MKKVIVYSIVGAAIGATMSLSISFCGNRFSHKTLRRVEKFRSRMFKNLAKAINNFV